MGENRRMNAPAELGSQTTSYRIVAALQSVARYPSALKNKENPSIINRYRLLIWPLPYAFIKKEIEEKRWKGDISR